MRRGAAVRHPIRQDRAGRPPRRRPGCVPGRLARPSRRRPATNRRGRSLPPRIPTGCARAPPRRGSPSVGRTSGASRAGRVLRASANVASPLLMGRWWAAAAPAGSGRMDAQHPAGGGRHGRTKVEPAPLFSPEPVRWIATSPGDVAHEYLARATPHRAADDAGCGRKSPGENRTPAAPIRRPRAPRPSVREPRPAWPCLRRPIRPLHSSPRHQAEPPRIETLEQVGHAFRAAPGAVAVVEDQVDELR